MNAAGATLKPKVFCIPQLTSKRKAGHPDFGLFVQLRGRGTDAPEWPEGQPPEHGVLGRDLTLDEARHVTRTARRLAALRLMTAELDANYRACAAAAVPLALAR